LPPLFFDLLAYCISFPTASNKQFVGIPPWDTIKGYIIFSSIESQSILAQIFITELIFSKKRNKRFDEIIKQKTGYVSLDCLKFEILSMICLLKANEPDLSIIYAPELAVMNYRTLTPSYSSNYS
jgi:hypothetical protein